MKKLLLIALVVCLLSVVAAAAPALYTPQRDIPRGTLAILIVDARLIVLTSPLQFLVDPALKDMSLDEMLKDAYQQAGDMLGRGDPPNPEPGMTSTDVWIPPGGKAVPD
jgi:hypothetical protein